MKLMLFAASLVLIYDSYTLRRLPMAWRLNEAGPLLLCDLS